MAWHRIHEAVKVSVEYELKIRSSQTDDTYERGWIPFRLCEVMGIHYLAWINDLNAGTIELVQRHEDWMVATVNSSMYPLKRDPDAYIRDYERPEGSCGR